MGQQPQPQQPRQPPLQQQQQQLPRLQPLQLQPLQLSPLQPPVLQRVKQQLQLVGKAFLVGACLETTAPLPLQCPPPQPAGMVYLAGDFLGMNVILPCLPHQPLLTPQLLVKVAFLDGVSLAMDVNPKP